MKLIGWKIVGDHYPEVSKRILIAGPHTSNWDFPLGIMVRSIIRDDIKYVGKSSLFKPPLGWIMRKLGGIGVDRTKSNNFVEAVVNEFNNHKKLAILFAPEGSRKKVDKFKTGFYHIARLAEVPILPAVLDFKTKEFKFLPLYNVTEDVEKEMAFLENIYRGVEGYNPKNGFY
jgi:1-acyl-sn-glycerol-3-phosphate acyltransferase